MAAVVSLRACAAQFCAALLAAMLYGCCSISVSHEFGEGVGGGPLGGRYRLDGVDAPLAAAIRKHAPKSVVFTDNEDVSALPLKIDFREVGEDKYTTSAIQVLPGCLTLCVLPVFLETHKSYCISVERPDVVDNVSFTQIQRDAFSSLPIGFLPYACPLDGYEYGIADHNRLDEETRKDAISAGLANAIAQAVISTLTKARYDAYMKALADNARNKKIADEENHQENVMRMAESGWPQEAMLRDFAVKETTGLWDVVVSFRAEISIRKNRLQKLSDAIKGFGMKPEEDTDYIKCKGEYDLARNALVQIFKSLENAYLAASKNEALYDSAEARKKTRKAVDECSRIAIDAADRILNNNNPITQKQRRQK